MKENPKKTVRLVVGEGASKIDIGVATVETLPNGTTMANLSIDNAQIAEALGVTDTTVIQAIVPVLNWKD